MGSYNTRVVTDKSALDHHLAVVKVVGKLFVGDFVGG